MNPVVVGKDPVVVGKNPVSDDMDPVFRRRNPVSGAGVTVSGAFGPLQRLLSRTIGAMLRPIDRSQAAERRQAEGKRLKAKRRRHE